MTLVDIENQSPMQSCRSLLSLNSTCQGRSLRWSLSETVFFINGCLLVKQTSYLNTSLDAKFNATRK